MTQRPIISIQTLKESYIPVHNTSFDTFGWRDVYYLLHNQRFIHFEAKWHENEILKKLQRHSLTLIVNQFLIQRCQKKHRYEMGYNILQRLVSK